MNLKQATSNAGSTRPVTKDPAVTSFDNAWAKWKKSERQGEVERLFAAFKGYEGPELSGDLHAQPARS